MKLERHIAPKVHGDTFLSSETLAFQRDGRGGSDSTGNPGSGSLMREAISGRPIRLWWMGLLLSRCRTCKRRGLRLLISLPLGLLALVGRRALERLGVEVAFYVSSEIDEAAKRVLKAAWPEGIDLGDVTAIVGKVVQEAAHGGSQRHIGPPHRWFPLP